MAYIYLKVLVLHLFVIASAVHDRSDCLSFP